MTGRRGVVWYGHRQVGNLREDEDRNLRFVYTNDWLHEGGFPISIGLPFSSGDMEVDGGTFFAGLLPEGNVRQRICRQLGITFADDTGLLLAIGGDCAGALSILPIGISPEDETGPPKIVTDGEINRMIRSHGEDASVFSGREQRFSLAGAQEKQPVIYDGNSYSLPDHINPSSHILKFETIPWVCFAEYTANAIAHRIGLPAVTTEFLQTGELNEAVPCLRIERYDRARDETGNLVRLHQEDLLQALGLPAILKYQRDGGPSIRDVAELLREHTARPVEALSHLRDWQILNNLIGNWDGHAKNLALLYAHGQVAPVFAPFYDLISIEFFNVVRPGTWSRDMALSIGAQYRPERITHTDWEMLADDLGMPPKRLCGRLEELANRLPEATEQALQAFSETHGDKVVYGKLEGLVRKRCRWTLNSVFKNRAGNR